VGSHPACRPASPSTGPPPAVGALRPVDARASCRDAVSRAVGRSARRGCRWAGPRTR
jgi:hypothetical protein